MTTATTQTASRFYVTFGEMYRTTEHPYFTNAHPDGYLTIDAPDELAARHAAIARIGNHWACLYTANEFAEQAADFPRNAIGYLAALPNPAIPAAGTRVTWVTNHDRISRTTGRIVAAGRRKAWTPNDFTASPPADNMVIVLWDGNSDPSWEYVNELLQH